MSPDKTAEAAAHTEDCPGCGQTITDDGGKLECGGVGEGVCLEAAFAFDTANGRSPEWEGNPRIHEAPTPEVQAAILEAFKEST